MKRNLGKYLHTAASAERVDRNWRRIALRLAKPRRLSRALLAATAAIALIAVVLLVRNPWRSASIEGTVLETEEGQRETVGLPDGSHIVLGPSSRLLLINVSRQRVRLELERGSIDVEATHLAGRTFSVGARVLDIDVVGTRFRVDVGPSDVQVSVREGRVRVTSRNDVEHPRYLNAGEIWSSHPTPAPSMTTPTVAFQAVLDAGRPHDAPPKPKLPPKFAELYREGRYVDAYTLVADDFDARSRDLGVDELFTLAETARLSGHPRDAATAFDALRTRFRTNPRAPLAALELGRLDLDELDQPSAAKEALDDAIRLQPDGFFREDADARRVQALEEMGLRVECTAARTQYLDAYPQGSHRASVAKRCR